MLSIDFKSVLIKALIEVIPQQDPKPITNATQRIQVTKLHKRKQILYNILG